MPVLDARQLDATLACPGCGESRWAATDSELSCTACKRIVGIDAGVLLLDGGAPDPIGVYYDDIGGPHFVGTTFETNLHVHLATLAYERLFAEFFPKPGLTLVDLGCGDGRLSLWALRQGFRVVAVDRTLAPLKRLAAAADASGLRGLIVAQAPFNTPLLRAESFDVALAIEAFTYLGDRYSEGLRSLRRLLREDGRGVVSEFCRSGRVLADVIAVNLENMRAVATDGRRFEKAGRHKLVQRLFRVAELAEECQKAGFEVVASRGISPIPMLFHLAHTFTSYPLRPALDSELERTLAALDLEASALSDLSRNAVMLLRKAR